MKKRKMQDKLVDTIHILGLKNFDDYSHLNPIEITIDLNSVIKTLSSYKKYKFRLIVCYLV